MECKIIQSAATSSVVIVLGWQMLGRLKSKLSITSILTILSRNRPQFYDTAGHVREQANQIMLANRGILS